jgi:hypothetical protein
MMSSFSQKLVLFSQICGVISGFRREVDEKQRSSELVHSVERQFHTAVSGKSIGHPESAFHSFCDVPQHVLSLKSVYWFPELSHVGRQCETVIDSHLDKEPIRRTRKPITWQVADKTEFFNT